MSINLQFKEFAIENLTSLPLPKSRNKSFELSDIPTLCDLLFCFINHEVDENSLKRIKSNFENDFEKIYKLDKKELAGAIEGLATNFESFLKKIALIKFADNVVWKGDGIYKGISKCMLFELIEGKASKINPNTPGEEFKEFPFPLVRNSGTSKAILDFVRVELRNAVHSANGYTRAQLIDYSNLVLGAYLIAINDNIAFFKKTFFQEFGYLENIVNGNEFSKLSKYYIDLYGKEENFIFENIAIEKLDGQQLIESINFDEIETDIEETTDLDDSTKDIARIDSVINISRDTKRFIITGEPGSGKTTSLKKILFENAKNKLNGVKDSRLPIYINASSYSLSKRFIYLLNNEVKFIDFDELSSKHKVLILIDGLNEIEEEFKRSAINDLKDLLEKYSNTDCIISSRKFGFINNFNINIYELKKLNETQIKQLVINVLDYQKGIFLWEQIEQNKQILELASNPLLLMMIIKVSSLKNNKIPANKGLLFKLFNDGILAREQKFYKTDIDTKKDILSHVAFWMRKNGIFKTIKKVQAKELVKEKLLEIDHSLGVNEILNELSDNNILIERNDELEFNHETQQEYFVALELQNIFFRDKNFSFDYNENKWFEPILICSDLFTKEEDIIDFFEFLFIGKKNGQPKLLDSIDSQDVNHKFFIACKVAFNLHITHPLIFKRAEEFLSNYLVFWHYRFSDTIITDFENIVKGVASLSSEVVFKKFFYNLKNLECWFYNREVDNRSNNLETISSFDQKFQLYMKSFSENLNGFPILYRVLQAKKKQFDYIHGLSRSVYKNLKIFSRYLLANSPTNQLVEAFKETNSLEILFELGKSDLEYFIENYFSTNGADNIEFYTFITDYHLKNVYGVEFLIKSLKNEKLELTIRLLILKKLLNINDYVEITFIALQEIFNKKDVLRFVDDTKQLLNKYSMDLLNSYGLDIIYTNPAIEKIDLELKIFLEQDDQVVFEYHSNKINYSVVLDNLNTISYNDAFVDFVNFDKFSKHTNVIILKGRLPDIERSIEKFGSGSSFTVHYLDYKRHANTKRFPLKELYKGVAADELFVRVRNQPSIIIKDIFNRFYNFKKIEILIGQEFRFSMKGLKDYPTKIFLKCASGFFDSKEALRNFKLFKINIDLSFPHNYHRDIIKSNYTFIRYLQKQIANVEVVGFIKAIGLCHYFFEQIPNLNFGIINYIYNDSSYSVVRIRNGKQFIAQHRSCANEEIQANDLVIIEDNLNIGKVDRNLLSKENFVESRIITLNSDKTEGFIEGTLEGDYYFLSQYCNFQPYKGMIVRFIPGLNFSKKNSSKPMAYCITLVVDKNNLARVTSIYKVCQGEDIYFNVYLIDVNTGEELFSRVYLNRKISSLYREVEREDVFMYEISHNVEKKFERQRIYLSRLLE